MKGEAGRSTRCMQVLRVSLINIYMKTVHKCFKNNDQLTILIILQIK